MRQSRCSLVLAGLLVLGAVGAWAKTPDGKPPSVETVCDAEKGAAFGLCNAYCEAMDCDSPNHRASDNACASVRRNFEKKTGRPIPCEMTCPCAGLLPLYGAIVQGTIEVQRCIADAQVVFVETVETTFAFLDAGPPATCSVNAEPPFVSLTSGDVPVCRVELIRAAESQGVPCEHPE